jgi:hypothetical protein
VEPLVTHRFESIREPDGPDHLALSIPDAMKANEMGRIGDRYPGTEWPIGQVFYSDPDKPRRMTAEGMRTSPLPEWSMWSPAAS